MNEHDDNPYASPTPGNLQEMDGVLPRVPENCPACGKPFHPVARLRPTASFSWLALLVIGFGSLLSLIFLAIWISILPNGRYPIVVIVGVPLIPALLVGLIAAKIPRVARLHCRGCGWQRRVRVRGR